MLGPLAIRADIAERFGRRLYQLSRRGPFALPPDLGGLLGCPAKELPLIADALGYGRRPDGLYGQRTQPSERSPASVEL